MLPERKKLRRVGSVLGGRFVCVVTVVLLGGKGSPAQVFNCRNFRP